MAVSVIEVPTGYEAEQVEPQLIPVPVTVPEPDLVIVRGQAATLQLWLV